jgi:hypothetical protein
MRKFAVVAAALAAVFGIAAVAYAANTYTYTATLSPPKSGTPSNPTPVSASLTFRIGSTDPATRPSPIKSYSVGLGAGIVPNNGVAASCSFAQASAQVLPSACTRATVGGGSVDALAGPTNTPTTKLACHLTVALLNQPKKNHLSIRIDGSPQAAQPCVIAVHGAIDATFAKVGSAAAAGSPRAAATIPIWALKFTVPPALLHAVAGFDTSVISNVTNVKKISKKVKGKRHGFLESIGCPKKPRGKRIATVVFTSEAGQTSSATSTSKCTK